MWRKIGSLSLILAAAAVIGGCSTDKPTDKAGDKAGDKDSVKKPEDKGPPITISAEQLAKEFKTDPVEADKKYKGRILIVEGKMHAYMDKEIYKESSLVLWGYQEKTEVPKLVQCLFTKDSQEKLETYKDKDKPEVKDKPTVKVKGIGSGSIDTIHYQIKDCVFLDK